MDFFKKKTLTGLARTSSELLLSLPHDQAVELLRRLKKDGIPASRIGEITEDPLGIMVI